MLQGGFAQPLQCPRQEGRGGAAPESLCVGWTRGLRMREATGPSWGWGWGEGVEGRPALSARLRTVLDPAEVGGISELTEACDWWSFGSLLYELLTGTVSSVWAGCGAWRVSLSIGWAGVSPTVSVGG